MTPYVDEVFVESLLEVIEPHIAINWTSADASTGAAFLAIGMLVSVQFTRLIGDDWRVDYSVTPGGRSATDIIQAMVAIYGGVFRAVREFLVSAWPDRLIFDVQAEEIGWLFEVCLRREGNQVTASGYRMSASGDIVKAHD